MPNFSKIFPTAFLLRKKLFSQQKVIAMGTHPQNYLSYHIPCHPEMADLIKFRMVYWFYGLPRWRSGKGSICQYRRCKKHRFEPWVGKIPWGRKCNPLQYSCLKNSRDRGAWRTIVHGATEGTAWLSNHTHTDCIIAQVEKTALKIWHSVSSDAMHAL